MRTRPALLSTLCAVISLVTMTSACGFGDDQSDTFTISGIGPQSEIVVATSLRGTLAFTNASQFACYGEANGGVTADSAIHYPLTDAQGNQYHSHLCI